MLGALSKILLYIHFTSAWLLSLLVLLVVVQCFFSIFCIQPIVFDCVCGLWIYKINYFEYLGVYLKAWLKL